MKKKIFTLVLSLFCLCGAVACSNGGGATPQNLPEQRQTTSETCPDGSCPDEQDETYPDGNCPDKQDETCPDGNCPDKQDETCPDGNCPNKQERRMRPLPVHPVHPRLPADRLFPPEFPIRPVQPLPEPNL